MVYIDEMSPILRPETGGELRTFFNGFKHILEHDVTVPTCFNKSKASISVAYIA